MTRDEAIIVLKMVEAHGLADEAKRMALEALTDRPTGMWVDKGTYSECSECGEVAQKVELCDCVYERLTNFCPNCGARMLREGDSE